MNSKKTLLVGVILTRLFFTFELHAQNLLLNGSMTGPPGEFSVAPNWTASSSGLNTPDINGVGVLHTSPGYNWYMGFPVASTDGGTWQNLFYLENIEQTVTGVSVGQTYYFSFEYCTQGIGQAGGEHYFTPMPPNVTIVGASGYINPSSPGSLFGWMRYTTSVIATSTTINVNAAGNTNTYLAYDGFYLSTMPIVPVKLLDFHAAFNSRISC